MDHGTKVTNIVDFVEQFLVNNIVALSTRNVVVAGILFVQNQTQLGGALEELLYRGLKERMRRKDLGTAQNVQSQPGPRNGHNKTTHVPQMTDRRCAHQGQDYIVVLLALVPIHRRHRAGPDRRKGCACTTTLGQHVLQKALLTVVRSQDGYLLRWIPNQHHILKQRHRILGFTEILVEKRCGGSLSLPLYCATKSHIELGQVIYQEP